MSSNTITRDSRFIINIDWSCFLALATSTCNTIWVLDEKLLVNLCVKISSMTHKETGATHRL